MMAKDPTKKIGGHPVISREEYKAKLDSGQKFRGAGLYEPQQADKSAEFFHVQLTPKQLEFKRRIK